MAVMKNFQVIAAVSALAAGPACKNDDAAAVARPQLWVTGIPDENPTELARRYAPLVEFLERELDADVRYRPVTDYGAAVQALAAGRIDFAWLGGFTHVQARTLAQVQPLVMRGIDREFKSVFVAHADSGIEKLADLRGKTFAFGSKSSTSGHLMPRYFLGEEANLDPAKDFAGAPVYSGAHDATAKLVASGRVQAGVLNEQVYQRMIRDGQLDPKRVKAIWTTPGYVDYVWTARMAVAPEIRGRFVDAFMQLDEKKPEDRMILELQGAKRFVRASARDFDAIEAVARETGLLKK